MSYRPNILVVCGKNKKRSRTAEHIFRNDPRFYIRSAGLSPKSERKISGRDLEWANLVFVMEAEHRTRIKDAYGTINLPEIEILYIEDEFEFMDEGLIDLLRDRMNDVLQRIYNL